MAKKSKIANNERKRATALRHREKRMALRAAAKNMKLSDDERSEARRKLEAMPRNTCENRVRTRCKLSGRPRGNYSKFQLSRLAFRELALKGLLPGVTKASW